MKSVDVIDEIFEEYEEWFQYIDHEHCTSMLIDLLCKKCIKMNEKIISQENEIGMLKNITKNQENKVYECKKI